MTTLFPLFRIPILDEPLSNLVLARRGDLPTTGTQASSLKLKRAEEMKPLDWSAVRALRSELDSVDKDRSGGAILLMGRGQPSSAGGDLRACLEGQRDDVPEMMLACDSAIATRSERIGDGHLNFGQMVGVGVFTLLPRLIGPNKARELIFSGRLLRAVGLAPSRLRHWWRPGPAGGRLRMRAPAGGAASRRRTQGLRERETLELAPFEECVTSNRGAGSCGYAAGRNI